MVAKLSFSPYLPNSALSPTFMGPLYCFVLWLVGDCGKIVILAIFAKFAAFANFYGAPSLLCASCFASLAIVAKLSFSPYLPNSPFSPTFMGPLYCFVLCLVGDCGKIVIFAIFAKFAASAFIALLCLLWGPFIALCFVLCLVGDCGKIVIFAIFAKIGALANFYGAPILLCALPRWRLWQSCHFRHICQIRRFRHALWPRWRLWQSCHFRLICQIRRFRQLLWGPYTALCFASLAIVAKLSFFCQIRRFRQLLWGPLYCFVVCLVGDCGKIVIFAIFAKFAVFANFYGAPILLCGLPRWRLWQNCHFSHICQIRRFRQLLWGPFTALCFVLCLVGDCGKIVILYLPNSGFRQLLPLYRFALCGKIVIFAIFAKFGAFANFWGPYTALWFASLVIVAKIF